MRPHTYAVALALAVGLSGLPTASLARPDTSVGSPRTAVAAAPADRLPQLPSGQVARTWAPLYMSDDHEYTRRQALTMARRFDLIAAMPYALKDHSAAMRAANPDLTLLAYANATLASPEAAAELPESAFARNASGGRIKATDWDTYLMESSSPAWRAAANQQCVERSGLGGFDGCLVDMLTLGIFSDGFVTALPVNPDTGRAYTETEYRGEMSGIAAYLRGRSPGLVQIGNTVENSYRYWEADVPSRPLVASVPGSQMEDFLRGAHSATNAWPSPADWKRNVDVITDMEAAGKAGLFTTKLWSGASKSQVAQWQGYAMASFLMGAGGKSFFAFTRSRDRAGASQANAPYAMPKRLGMPVGPMRQLGSGAWTRQFQNGVAVVNPTSKPARVSVPSGMRRLNGARSGSLVLQAHSGDVLTESTASPYRLGIKRLEKRALSLVQGRWTRIRAVVTNRGAKAVPRGVVRADGAKVKTRRHRIPALRPGRSTRLRVAVKLVGPRHGRRAVVKLIYSAGGQRDVARFTVRVRR